MKKHLLTLLIVGLLVWFAFNRPEYKSLKPYSGFELKSKVLNCNSDQTTSAGYWRHPLEKTVEVGSTVLKESQVSSWRITLAEGNADVIIYSGSLNRIQESEKFSLVSTDTGFLLMSQRPANQPVDLIGIDSSNGSFVYTTQQVNSMWNRATMWIGNCSDGQ